MKAISVEHKGMKRIKVVFPFNNEIIMQLRQIDDCRWSETMRAWHIPDTPDAIGKFISIFPDAEFNEQSITIDKVADERRFITPEEKPLDKRQITLYVTGRNIIIRMPKIEADV